MITDHWPCLLILLAGYLAGRVDGQLAEARRWIKQAIAVTKGKA